MNYRDYTAGPDLINAMDVDTGRSHSGQSHHELGIGANQLIHIVLEKAFTSHTLLVGIGSRQAISFDSSDGLISACAHASLAVALRLATDLPWTWQRSCIQQSISPDRKSLAVGVANHGQNGCAEAHSNIRTLQHVDSETATVESVATEVIEKTYGAREMRFGDFGKTPGEERISYHGSDYVRGMRGGMVSLRPRRLPWPYRQHKETTHRIGPNGPRGLAAVSGQRAQGQRSLRYRSFKHSEKVATHFACQSKASRWRGKDLGRPGLTGHSFHSISDELNRRITEK